MPKQDVNWFVYMIVADDESLYTGITTDVNRRFSEHESGEGAKYFRSRKPVKVVHTECFADRSLASKREWEIKQLSRSKKLCLIDD